MKNGAYIYLFDAGKMRVENEQTQVVANLTNQIDSSGHLMQ